MKNTSRHIRYFLFSQSLADGIRITLEIILPAFLFSQFGKLDIGLAISTGALCVSLSDGPGPVEHKRNGMLYCTGFVFLVALLTGLINNNIVLLTLLLLGASFFFTMLTIYGNRAASVGIAALLILVLRLDKVMPLREVALDAVFILCGGVWYMLVALLFYRLTPYRQAQRALGNCIHETSLFLLIKAELYDPGTNIPDEYRKLLAQQVIVNERQDEVRELLFKSDEFLRDNNTNALVFTFSEVVDMYERTMATWYDYPLLRQKLASSGILQKVSEVIKIMALELDNIGFAIQSNMQYKRQYDTGATLEELKRVVDSAYNEDKSNMVLKKILVNFRNLQEKLVEITKYFENGDRSPRRKRHKGEYAKFVTHQEISLAVFRDNLTLASSAFRHSLRMAITCMAGLAIGKLILYGHHSYWLLLTIIFILKPGYSLTRERNIQRIAGTIAGGLLGVLIIATIQDRIILFSLILFFMLGTYTFQRLNYIVMVIFTTPYILILFHFLGLGFMNIARDRVLDTAIGSVLAFMASYLLFPDWESKHLRIYMEKLLEAHIHYLQKLLDAYAGATVSTLEYKLVRKELYVNMANFSSAFRRMLSEPKSKQKNVLGLREFEILNHVLASNIASLFEGKTGDKNLPLSKEILRPVKRSIAILEEGLEFLSKTSSPVAGNPEMSPVPVTITPAGDDLKEHIAFVHKISADINKAVKKMEFDS